MDNKQDKVKKDSKDADHPRDMTGSTVKPKPENKQERVKKDLKDIECFQCHKKGHYKSNCLDSAGFCSEIGMNCSKPKVQTFQSQLSSPVLLKATELIAYYWTQGVPELSFIRTWFHLTSYYPMKQLL